MKTQQSLQAPHAFMAGLTLAGMVIMSMPAHASGGYGDSSKRQSHAVEGIQEMCVQAIEGMGRQPEAEEKILRFVREGFRNITKRKDGSQGISKAIGKIRGQASESVARQPEAERKILNLVEECEDALDALRHKSSRH